jgi:hypothetical protein
MASESVADQLARVGASPLAHQATEPDEEVVLRGLYGEPDEHGFYTGEASDGDG